ncbi:MAG: hypothetical protein ACJ74Z_20630 [Bryobacteraceae bacterium]
MSAVHVELVELDKIRRRDAYTFIALERTSSWSLHGTSANVTASTRNTLYLGSGGQLPLKAEHFASGANGLPD